jgi:hypothetical protein
MSKAVPRFKRNNPALPPIAGAVYLVTVGGDIDNQTWYCNFGYMASSFSQVSVSESNISASFITNVIPAFKACLDPTNDITSVKVACVSVPTRAPFVQTGGSFPLSGTAGATHLPSTVAGIISKYTPTRGQHGRGRNYIPGIPNTFVTPTVDPDRLNSTGITAYNALATALDVQLTDTGGVVLDMCIFKRVAKGLSVLNGQDVSTFQTRPLLGTVRRRRIGRGK